MANSPCDCVCIFSPILIFFFLVTVFFSYYLFAFVDVDSVLSDESGGGGHAEKEGGRGLGYWFVYSDDSYTMARCQVALPE